MNKIAGYREIDHTADWELEVWAPDLPSLLDQAARGMCVLSQTSLRTGPRVAREFEIPFTDKETLIVDFLSELLFFAEAENLGFDGFQIEIEAANCKFRVSGAPILEQSKAIKAVTFHNLKIQQTEGGLTVNIVFDV